MGLFPAIKSLFSGLLKEPGDEMSAKITPTGKQVLKIETKDMKKTIVKNPTGSVVEYISYKDEE